MSVTKTKHLRIITLVLLVILFNSEHVFANNLKEIVNLKGYWKFSVGDNPEWKNPDFNDTDWERHYVPRSWESNGYKGYNGFAWYRTEFDLYSAKPRAKEWDYAAGHAIAESAGAIIRNFQNKKILYGKKGFKNPSLLVRRNYSIK